MLFNLVISIVAIAQCDAFAFSSPNHRHPVHRRPYATAPMLSLSHSDSGMHLLDTEHPSTPTANQHTSQMWELGLLIDSNPKLPLEYTTRCINQVVGISDADSLEVVTQAYRHGIALIEELPFDIAVSYKTELEKRGISCEMVPAEDGEEAAPRTSLEDSSDLWELGLLRNAQYSRERTSRCLCQVVGISESDAFEATSQAYRLGVALIDEFHSEHVEYFAAELTRLGIAVCVVPAGDE
mmetsp:Transcript_23629/g.36567  ORF Transcript_23629/g.36567 Transcript_23629/m.36567 type:complete len:239 (-) Transcript_23629:69-785(-)